MEPADLTTQDVASSFARKLNRRSFLTRTMQLLAGAIATVAIGQKATEVAFAASDCAYIGGNRCSGCGADASCPSSWDTCTPANTPCTSPNPCPYSTGWWYLDNGEKCRDCRVYGPATCSPPYYGLCTCRGF